MLVFTFWEPLRVCPLPTHAIPLVSRSRARFLPTLAPIFPYKYAKVARMLLEHGADVNAQDKNGWTPFVLAKKENVDEIIHVLVQHGAWC